MDHRLHSDGIDALHHVFEFGDGSTGEGCGRLVPTRVGFSEKLPGFCGEIGEDRREVDHEGAEEVEGDGADVLQLLLFFGIFAEFPGGIVFDVGIGLIGEFHDHAHGFAVVAFVVGSGDILAA